MTNTHCCGSQHYARLVGYCPLCLPNLSLMQADMKTVKYQIVRMMRMLIQV